jgi:hypothetical protein
MAVVEFTLLDKMVFVMKTVRFLYFMKMGLRNVKINHVLTHLNRQHQVQETGLYVLSVKTIILI